MNRGKTFYSVFAAAGLLSAAIAFLCVKYSPDALLLVSGLAVDSVYVKLFVNSAEDDALHISRAVARKDLRLCRKVSTRYRHSVMPRQTCYREVLKAIADPGTCKEEEIAEFIGEQHCYVILAVATGDGALCERAGSGPFSIRDNCYLALALEKNDSRFCLKIPVQTDSQTDREYCLKECAAKKKYDESPEGVHRRPR